MLRCLVPFLLILETTNSWVMEVNPNKVVPELTRNVNIICHHDDNNLASPPTMNIVYRIRIMKYKDKKWNTVAKMTRQDSIVKTSLTDAESSGIIDKPNNSYIKMNFKVATEDILGKFMCEIDVIDESETMQVITTKSISVYNKPISHSDFVNIVYDVQLKEKNDHLDLKKLMIDMSNALGNITGRVEALRIESEKTDNEMSAAIANLTDYFDKMNVEFTNETKQIDINIVNINVEQNETIELIKTLHKYDPVITWPSGLYTLLKPSTGCPDTLTSTWQHSSIRVSTRPGEKNTDSSSSELHLHGDVFQHTEHHNYVYTEMCSKASDGKLPAWPKGTYCLQVYAKTRYLDENCPKGFGIGDTLYGRYDDGQPDIFVNLPGKNDGKPTKTWIDYCCRNDGKLTDPIVLPRQSPFYLFRYGGACQRVLGMDVRNEWIHLDTVKKIDSYWRYHPDIDITDGFRLEICYYTPRY